MINEIVPKMFDERFSKIGREELQRILFDDNMETTSKESSSYFLKEGLILSQTDPTEIRFPNE